MKTAQELRSGNVIMVGSRPARRPEVRVQQIRPQCGCGQDEAQEPADRRGFRSRLQGRRQVRSGHQLDKKEVTYSYFADPLYVFMDADYNQYEVEAENMVDALKYLEDGLACEVVFYDGKAISVELPNSVVREVIYTEPAVKGDTSGKVMKPAKPGHRFRTAGSGLRRIGDKIEIDTRTDEYRSRAK
jgi:elongation factor P